jgi:MFS family permease
MPRRWWALVAVSLATFMTYLDNNVTNVAIPTIQRSLHLSVAGLEWVVSSYILVFAGLLLAGWPTCTAAAGCSWPACRCSPWPRSGPGWPAAAAC